ncbi:MAG: tetratricopeptide repeat protein [Gallionellaceae bacterium]
MRLSARIARAFAIVLLSAAAAPALPVPVAIDSMSSAFPDAEVGGDTAQAREFRAGIQALIQGKLSVAKGHYEAALKLDPNYAPAMIGLADIAQRQGNTHQVEPYLQRAERAAPQSPAVHLAWGRYLIRGKQFKRAENSLLKAHELAPKAIPPLLELGDLYLRLGRPADGLKVYREAVAQDAANKFAQYGLGTAAAASGQRDEALRAFEAAATLAPKDAAPLRASGLIYLEAGALDKAIAAFDNGLARQPNFIPLMLDRADALARQKRWDDALTQVGQAEKLAPNSAEIQLKMADVYQGAERWNEAESRYLQAIRLNPRSAIAYNNLAWMTVSRNNGNSKKAVEWARKAVALSPGSSPFYDTLGWVLHAAGDLPGAEMSLKKAIELEPKVAGYHFHLGVVQGELKKPAAARASLQRALELDPNLPQADEARRLLKSLPAM